MNGATTGDIVSASFIFSNPQVVVVVILFIRHRETHCSNVWTKWASNTITSTACIKLGLIHSLRCLHAPNCVSVYLANYAQGECLL